MLLYLVKHSRPDISNAVRELSKVADGATKGHWKALLRAIKYVLDTENYGLRIKPKVDKGFYLEGISDSEYAGDSDTQISVYGYVLYFCGCPIAWKSKSGKSVTLSSTEAEYFATSEIAKEVIFAKQVLESISIDLSYPIEIKCDNIGAIYLANNHSTSQRTKHIDTRRHFVREYVENEVLKVVFVKSEDNEADILTKNTSEDLFKKHMSKNIEEVEAGDNVDGHIAYLHYLHGNIRSDLEIRKPVTFSHSTGVNLSDFYTGKVHRSYFKYIITYIDIYK
ncbi:MAG TPA: Ty1/Copia family ribonuclease HI [Fusibacter sp.]|nr:Ty1/Copia family ribonuclease HI [Fusibacter sp.]